jgi:acetyl esterase
MVVYTLAETLTPTRIEIYKKTPEYELKAHFYEPAGHKPGDKRGCVFALHGGGWTGGEPWIFDSFANEFMKMGLVGISAQYRLIGKEPNVTPFECAKDGRSLMRYLKANASRLGIDPEKIVAAGGSAGAHVAAATALFDGVDDAMDDLSISPTPAAMMLYYPVIDTSADGGYGNQKCGDQWEKISPAHNVRPGTVPTFLAATKEDKVTPYKGVERFERAMHAAGSKYDALIKETGPHGYFLYDLELFKEVMARSAAFLKNCGIV